MDIDIKEIKTEQELVNVLELCPDSGAEYLSEASLSLWYGKRVLYLICQQNDIVRMII